MDARNLLIVLLAAAALFAAGAMAVATAYSGYVLWVAEAAGPAPAPQPPAKEVAELQPIAEANLTDPEPDAPSRFVWLPSATPEQFCRALGGLGLGNPDFQTAQWPAKGWTCVADLLKPVSGEDAAVSSLFVSARGLDSRRLENFRVKLNLLDPATAPVVTQLAQDVLDRIFAALGFEAPAAAVEALRGPKEGVIESHGVTFDLKREFSGPRYNLIVSFPQRLGTGGGDRFLPRPRAGYGAG